MFTNGSERAPDDAPESSTLKRGYHARKIAKLQDSKVVKCICAFAAKSSGEAYP